MNITAILVGEMTLIRSISNILLLSFLPYIYYIVLVLISTQIFLVCNLATLKKANLLLERQNCACNNFRDNARGKKVVACPLPLSAKILKSRSSFVPCEDFEKEIFPFENPCKDFEKEIFPFENPCEDFEKQIFL